MVDALSSPVNVGELENTNDAVPVSDGLFEIFVHEIDPEIGRYV
jgi:hypothetical protein